MGVTKLISKRGQEKLRKRHEILSCANDLFSINGYNGVSMHDISEMAEFATGTLYKFFRSKEDLYCAFMMEQLERLERQIIQVYEKKGDIERLKAYIDAALSESFPNHVLLNFIVFDYRGTQSSLEHHQREDLKKRYYSLLRKLAGIIESGIKNKSFNSTVEPLLLAIALENVINSSMLIKSGSFGDYHSQSNAQAILDIFLKGLTD